jgi:hypothetical protein
MSTLLADAPTPAGPPGQAPAEGFDGRSRREDDRTEGLRSLVATVWPTLLIAGVLCLVTFIAGGGLNLGPMTAVEIGLTVGCGLAAAAAVVLTPADRPAFGLWPAGLLLAFAALSALSVVWSVQPDASWQAASRLLTYSCVFGLAVLLARAVPQRWSAVLGGLLLASAVVCGYALLTKIFPNRLGSEQVAYYARLREPYGYWNAIGLAAALGAIACMWLGARRAGHALLSALAYPAMGLMLVTLMLAYSRGALAALVLGLALWFCLVPLRLRGATVLIVGALGAAVVVAWDFSRAVLTTDSATLAARIYAGHQLGVLLTAMLLVLAIAGVAIGFFSGRHPPSPLLRRRAGTVLLSLPVVAVIAFVGLLAVSHRGLFGSVSHGVHSLTDPDATVPANGPGRLTAIGSARARYWKEALEVFKAHPLLGSGAEGYATARLRYRTAPIKVQQAHGYVVQTLADLGLVGLLITLALLAAWMAAAGRATHPLNRHWSAWRWRRWPRADRAGAPGLYSPERIGLLTMLCLVGTFGIHSFVDWTWYVPGLACMALLCAGWLAGRGPLTAVLAPAGGVSTGGISTSGISTSGVPASGVPASGISTSGVPADEAPAGGILAGGAPAGKRAAVIAVAVLIAALLAAWAEWQPQRSVEASNQALALIKDDPGGALAAAHAAVSRDPLSAEALVTLAAIQQGTGQDAAARATYEHAVHIQPSNWQTWEALGEYELQRGHSAGALNALRAAVYLNPEAVAPNATIDDEELLTLRDDYLQALRDTARAAPSPAARVALRAGRRSHAS